MGDLAALTQARVLVTGATGFLGRHLVRRLVALGNRPTIMLRPGVPSPDGFSVVNALLEDETSLRNAVLQSRPDVIFHLAARTETTRGAAFDSIMMTQNLAATVALARTAAEIGVSRFVAFGTCEEYGRQTPPFAETLSAAPLSPYSASKAAATVWLSMMHDTQAFPAVILRPFLAYGPGQAPPRMVASACLAAIRGDDFAMTSGRQHRELTYIGDMVDGILLSAVTQGAVGRIINLGSGQEHRIADIVRMIFDLADATGRPLIGAIPDRPNEMQRFCADIALAESVLGWKATTSLETGLRKTLDWARAHGNTPMPLQE